MIDIHNHILFGVDDGSPDKETSIQMLKQAEQDGIEKVILTPHYVHKQKGYSESYEVIEERFKELKAICEQERLSIQLFIGNELFIHKDMDMFLDERKVHTMADSNYVLVEFPMSEYAENYDEYLYNISLSGYRIIIAHPERYEYVLRHPEFVNRWTVEGYLLQSNGDSLKDKRKAKVIHQLIEKGQLSFIASDGHSLGRPAVLSSAYRDIETYYSSETAERLFRLNAECILNDKPLPENPKITKHKFFWRF